MKHLRNCGRKSQAMPTLVKTLPKFEDRLEALEKKYHNAIDQAEKFTRRLERGERPGNVVPRVGAAVSGGAQPGGKRRGAQGLPHYLLRHNAKSDLPAHDVQQEPAKGH